MLVELREDQMGFSKKFQVLYLGKGCATQDSRGLALCLFIYLFWGGGGGGGGLFVNCVGHVLFRGLWFGLVFLNILGWIRCRDFPCADS